MPINVYAIATPFVLGLIVLEVLFCLKKDNGYYEFQDSVASLGTAIINQCVNVLVAVLWYPVLGWLSAHGLFEVRPSWWTGLLLFLGVDFLFYWFHRFGHRTNLGWAAHMPHHSTEELNYAVALRASVTQRFFSFFFYWPLAALGFDAEWVIGMVAFHLVLQLIPHTRVVPKLPSWIESWMNTPSHHRVHHARNERYLDKNYGGFLIVWDKLFGTFEPETEACSYGVTSPPNTWDPTFINFQVWREVVKDAWDAPRWLDKLRIWFMPTGWRPDGVPERKKGAWRDAGGREVKFQSTMLPRTKGYLVTQVVLGFPLMLLVIHGRSPLAWWQKVLVSLLIWASATAWSAILESRRWAVRLELGRLVAIAAVLAGLGLAGTLSLVPALGASAVALGSCAWFFVLTWKGRSAASWSVA
ncbi:MAG: sterol desaturase family protein [Myxococcaceae bacterium]|nr:sterol desaturase family protein [Myxococcaceae bacterium]